MRGKRVYNKDFGWGTITEYNKNGYCWVSFDCYPHGQILMFYKEEGVVDSCFQVIT